MGLSIHYSGIIKHRDLISVLKEEIIDVCTSLNWRFTAIENETLKGIVFSPDECEPLFFTFDQKDQLVSPILLQYNIEPVTTISVKTQFAGISTHIALIKLLKHLSKKYFTVFDLFDEGGYWETDDEEVLKGQFKNYEALFDLVTNALGTLEVKKGESPESLIERMVKCIEEELQKNNK